MDLKNTPTREAIKRSLIFVPISYSYSTIKMMSFSQLCDRIYTSELENKNKVAGINITENKQKF
jgi:hypothetical protein